MKINKFIIFILFIMMLFPVMIEAKECRKDNIQVETVELTDITGNAEETTTPNNDNNQINLNTKMNVLGDSLTYKVTIKNTSNDDYIFDQEQITKDYINYDISYEDDESIIKAGEEKVIYLTVNYANQPQAENLTNGVYTNTSQVSFNLIDGSNAFMNPETRSRTLYTIIITFLVVGIPTIIVVKNKKAKMMIIVISLFLIPQIVHAACTCTLDINLNLEIDAKEATFLTGAEVNVKMKQLAGDDTSTLTNQYAFEDGNIMAIYYSETEPISTNREDKNIVSTPESEYPIYMWYENGTIYWWSEDKTPSLNEDSSFMLNKLNSLMNIDGLKTCNTVNVTNFSSMIIGTSLNNVSSLRNWNVANATNLQFMFYGNEIISLDGLENWNVSNVIKMNYTFSGNYNLNDIQSIKNWNVSNVNDMSGLFQNDFALEEIDISNWDTKSLEIMDRMFSMGYVAGYVGHLKKIILSEKFDTSKVKNMSFVFYNNRVIEDYSFIQYIDTSSATNFLDIFYGNFNLTSLEWFKDWDVSNVTNMMAAFTYNPNIKSLDGIENWDVSNVTSMKAMFSHSPLIEDASALNDWDISNVTDFEMMFFQAQTHPEFTKREGTWSNGTFNPTT